MRHWRYHSKHVLTDAFRPGGCRRDRTKRRSDERIVAGCFTLYSKDRERTAIRRPGAAPGGAMRRKPAGSTAAWLSLRWLAARRAIRTVGTRSRYKAPLTRPWPIS